MLQSKILIFLFQLVFVCVLVVACNSTTTTTERSISTAGMVATLNTKGCIKIYDPNIDYFPEKVSIIHATGFVVEYHKHYKVINVRNPWRNADTTFQYVLVQCGTPIPEGFKETQVIKVPVNTVVSLSNTHLPHLEKLGLVDKLIGVSAFNQVNTPSVVQKIKTGKLTEVGNNASINVERLLELNPELVTTYGVGKPEVDIYPKLLEAGLKVAINAEYMETSPLGKTEWLKFTALFFNHEAIAEQVFGEIANRYQALATKASQVKNRPTVFAGFNFKGTWYMPGGKSYMAKFLDDAGANYLWAADNSAGSLPLAFEAVFERAATADYWLNGSQSWNLQQVISEDNRYADFTAVKKGHVFNNNARVNESGGNDYWESGISNPDLVLSDLIKIFHPELLPAHKLVYYRQMNLSK